MRKLIYILIRKLRSNFVPKGLTGSSYVLAGLLIAQCSLQIAYSQQPTEEWVRRYPPNNSASIGRSIKSDSLGYIYVLADTGNGYGFIKYDQNGNLLFTASYWPGGFEYGTGTYMDVSKCGNVYITGNINNTSANWIYTVKYNSNGLFLWGKLYNRDLNNSVNGIKVDKNGDAIIIGSAANVSEAFALAIKYRNTDGDTLWVNYFNNGNNSASYRNLIIDEFNNLYMVGRINQIGQCLTVKCLTTGSLSWFNTFTYDASRTNLGWGISIDNNGNVYSIGTQARPMNLFDSYLLKINNSGITQWNIPLSGFATGNNSLWGPVVTSDGSNIYYTASVRDTVGSGYNIATYKINSAGSLQWAKIFNGGIPNGLNLPAQIKLDKFNNIYVTGMGYYQTTGNDMVTLKYNPLGILQWSVNYNGLSTNGVDYSNDVFIDSNTNIYITGASKKVTGTVNDATTIKYNQTVGILNQNNELPQQVILKQNYPNPFNSTTVISYILKESGRVSIILYNSLGQFLKQLQNSTQMPGEYNLALNMLNYSSGSYFYVMKFNDETIYTKKLILNK